MTVLKRIKTDSDMSIFQRGPGYRLIVSYIERFCLLVKGLMPNSDSEEAQISPDIERCIRWFESIEKKVAEIDPIEQPMRFGNKAFRTFHSWLQDNISELLRDYDDDLVNEAKLYLLDSFGNATRIDYGTGHEAAFFMFLIILIEHKQLSVISDVILVVFKKYIALVRMITSKYTMEPAGSHGVWGLDDYHHLPFLFGAAQLIGHENRVKPCNMVEMSSESDMQFSLYADMIQYIKNTKCKFARFSEVAPLINDFTRLESWSQVCMGLLRMYKSEVLAKRPIAQHFFFGNVINWEDTTSSSHGL